MALLKAEYGPTTDTVDIDLASLANGAAVQSAPIDNASDKYVDALVQISVKTHASSAPTGAKAVAVYAYGSVDGGTTYPDGVGGAKGAVTLNSPTQLRRIGTILVTAAATVYEGMPMSVAHAFGGVLPEKWGIVVLNDTGFALDAVEASFKKVWQGVYLESA